MEYRCEIVKKEDKYFLSQSINNAEIISPIDEHIVIKLSFLLRDWLEENCLRFMDDKS